MQRADTLSDAFLFFFQVIWGDVVRRIIYCTLGAGPKKERSVACKDGGFVGLKVTFGLLKSVEQVVLWGFFWDSSQLC